MRLIRRARHFMHIRPRPSKISGVAGILLLLIGIGGIFASVFIDFSPAMKAVFASAVIGIEGVVVIYENGK
jgi:hypothetical protein